MVVRGEATPSDARAAIRLTRPGAASRVPLWQLPRAGGSSLETGEVGAAGVEPARLAFCAKPVHIQFTRTACDFSSGENSDETMDTGGNARARPGRVGKPSTSPAAGETLLSRGPGRCGGSTFDIGDVAKTGAAVGAAVGYKVNDRWVVLGEFDYGRHQDKATSSTDINTLHYIAKVGYSLTGPRERGWEALVNLGAGAVTFDVEGATESFTYFAINAGAKIAYN